jgi:hypothetical protein
MDLTWPQFFKSFGKKRTEQCEKCEYFGEKDTCSKGRLPKVYDVGYVEPKTLHADFDCEDFRCKMPVEE